MVAAIAGLAACDSAPHDNPFDPESGFPQFGAVSGQVTGARPPFDARPNVRVRLIPVDDTTAAERSAVTDEDGRFTAAGLSPGTYRVFADGDGFRASAQEVGVTAASTTPVTLRVDALPIVTSTSVRSIRTNSSFTTIESDVLEVSATATDPDGVGEVETAAFVVEAFDIRVPLSQSGPGTFSGTLRSADLPGGQLEPLSGKVFYVEVTDLNNNVVRSDPFSLVRVIDPPPGAVFPTNSEIVNLSRMDLILEWERSPLPYEHVFEIEVFREQFVPDVLVERATVPSTATTYQVTETLTSGTYFWTVAYVDAAGNRSRSLESRFEVQR